MIKYRNLTVLALFLSIAFFPPLVSGQQTSEDPEKEAVVESPQTPRDFLGLTPEQKTKLEEFRKLGREKNRTYLEEIRKVRNEMREMMIDPEANEKEVLKLYDQMAKLRAEQFRYSLQRNKEFKKIFTPEQLEKLESVKKKISRRGYFRRGRFMGPRGFTGRGNFSREGRMNRFWRRDARLRGRPFMRRRRWR